MRRWAAARPLVVREAPSRQTSVWREACPPARRPRRELRSARRLEARPGPAGLAPLSSRAAALRHRRYIPRRPRTPSDRAVSPDERDKTLPTHHKTAIPSHFSLAGRTLYRSIHQQAEQGELCTAHRTTSGTKLSPHETRRAEPVQNSPSRRPRWTHPGQNSPNTSQTAIPSHFSLAGRTSSRLRQRQAEQGELCTAHRTTCGTKLSPLNSSAEATGQNSPRSS